MGIETIYFITIVVFNISIFHELTWGERFCRTASVHPLLYCLLSAQFMYRIAEQNEEVSCAS